MNNLSYLVNNLSYPMNNSRYLLNNLSYLMNNLRYLVNNLSYPINNLRYLLNNLSYLIIISSFLLKYLGNLSDGDVISFEMTSKKSLKKDYELNYERIKCDGYYFEIIYEKKLQTIVCQFYNGSHG